MLYFGFLILKQVKMEIAEILVLIFFDYLLKIPGAAIRWLFNLGRKPFSVIMNENPGLNIGAGFGLMIVIILIIIILNQ